MQTLERAISITLAISAIAIAGSVVHKSFGAPPAGGTNQRPPEFIEKWGDIAKAGIRSGRVDAKATIVEFVDFECPGCAVFHRQLKDLRNKFGDRVAVVYLPYPLPMHRFAYAAARGAECAEQTGRFDGWADVVFTKQDSLGLKSWGAYASEAGIADTAVIADCAKSSGEIPRVVQTRQLARLANVEGTPTVLVNGWRYHQSPSVDELEEVVRGIIEGRKVFPRK